MAMNDRKTIYRIRCPRLKEHIGIDTLTVKLPEGQLEVPTDPPVDFVANCASSPFDQPRLLVEAMQCLITILPGDGIPIVRNRYLSCYELLERLNHYTDLCVIYGECFLRHEEAQLSREMRERLRKELNEEILMTRVSSNMDKIMAQLIRDNKFRKANKKATYPTPKLNPRASSIRSVTEICSMKDALQDKCRGILQVAFLPEPEEGATREPRVLTPEEDIPDATGRPREERRRSNLSVNRSTNNAQQCPTDRPTVNFNDREQHRTNVINKVQQNLMNISNSNDQASNVNVHPDHPDHQNPWSRNTDQNRDNQSSGSSDTDSIGQRNNNWHSQKCTACSHRGHIAYNCEKKRNGELYCNRCRRNTHCNATCSVLHNTSTPRLQHHHYQGHPSPRQDGNHTVPPVEPNFTTRSSPAPSNAGSIVDVTQMFVMHLDENRQQTKLIEYRKDLLANISTYDGKDKKACLMWINQCEHMARNAKMSLKELIAAKAGPIVATQVQNFLIRVPGATDTQIKQMILECFSNMGTRTEAHHYLKKMTLDDD